MAIPTVTSITEDEGVPTGGYFVEIIGTNFQVPIDPLTLPPPYPFPIPDPPPTVTVEFSTSGGFSAFSDRVDVLSATRIFAIVPKALLPLDANGNTVELLLTDVTVRNVDSSGVLIPTEEVVATDAFTYRHANITNSTFHPPTIVTEHLLALLRSEIISNTSAVPHTEFDTDLNTVLIEEARLPQLVLLGPDLTESSGTRYLRDPVEVQISGSPEEYRQAQAADYFDLSYKLIGMSDRHIELGNLASLTAKVIKRNPILRPPRDLLDLSTGTIDFDMEWTSPPAQQQLTGQFGSNLRYFQAELVVRGVPITDIDPVLDDSTREQGTNLGDNLPEITTTVHPDDC